MKKSTIANTKEIYDIVYNPRLGDDEEAYKMLFYFGGFDACMAPISEHLFETPEDYKFRIEVQYPPGITRGKTKLPADAALMIIALIRCSSDDDPHKSHHGAQEAGTAALPLKGLVEAKTKLVFHNCVRVYKGIDFTKGELQVKALAPIPESEFKKPNKYTVQHNAYLEDKTLLVAAIIGQSCYAKNTQTINPAENKEIKSIPCMPPWEFHTYVLPGFMLSSGRNSVPHDPDWWERLLEMGTTRTNPDVSGKAARKYFLEELNEPRAIAATVIAACAIPTNYWRYGADQTEVGKRQYATENYTVLSRFKLGAVRHSDRKGDVRMHYITPNDDCENDGDDIRMLACELQKMQVNPDTHPVLAKAQRSLDNYVIVQALTAVHGSKEGDGEESNGEAEIGLHSMLDAIHKQHFMTAHGRINSARPLVKEWHEDVDPSAKVDLSLHVPIDGEGTGTVDPRGNDKRNTLGAAYGMLLRANEPALGDLKIIMPSLPGRKGISDKFYVSKVSFVVPELIESNYSSCMFTPVTIQNGGKVERMVSQEDFMTGSDKFGLRVEPSITAEQAEQIKHVASFYPPMGKFEPPEPLESSEVRQRYRMQTSEITKAMASCKRIPVANPITADFYAAYYQLTPHRIQSICETIKSSPEIVGVLVEEEAVAKYLGGYRIAFQLDPQRLTNAN